jgi:hypothetical protein
MFVWEQYRAYVLLTDVTSSLVAIYLSSLKDKMASTGELLMVLCVKKCPF